MVGRPFSKAEEMVPLNRDTLGTQPEMVRDGRRKGLVSAICILDADLENALCIVAGGSENVICTAHEGLESALYTVVEDLENRFCSDRSGLARLLDNGSALVMWLSEGCGDLDDA